MRGPGPQWVAVPDRFVGVETPSLVRNLSGIRFPYENGSAARPVLVEQFHGNP